MAPADAACSTRAGLLAGLVAWCALAGCHHPWARYAPRTADAAPDAAADASDAPAPPDAPDGVAPGCPARCTTPCDARGECLSVLSVAAGPNNTCALLSDRAVYCWGRNAHGESGGYEPGVGARLAPPREPVFRGAVSVDPGFEFTCAIREGDRSVWCWGSSAGCRIGCPPAGVDAGVDAAARPGLYTTPERIGELTGVVQIAVGGGDVLARLESGQVYHWGATGVRGPTLLSVDGVNPVSGAIYVGAGEGHWCVAVAGDGGVPRVFCAGTNQAAQLGDPTRDGGATVLPTGPLPEARVPSDGGAVVRVEPGDDFTCAERADHTIVCWGANGYRQSAPYLPSGAGLPDVVTPPAVVRRPGGLMLGTMLTAGRYHACVLNLPDAGGVLTCWGSDATGQLGRFGDSMVIEELNDTELSFVAAGGEHTCGWDRDDVFCWGRNSDGQLGIGGRADESRPMLVRWPR